MKIVFCFIILNLSYVFTGIAQTVSFLPIEEKGKWGLITNEGLVVVNPSYDSVEVSPTPSNDFIVSHNGKKGLVNFRGELHIPIEYDDIDYTHEDAYIVRKNNLYGVFSSKNKLLEIEYDEIRYLYTCTFMIRKGKRYGLIDIREGKNTVLLKPEYEYIQDFTRHTYFLKKDDSTYFYTFHSKTIKVIDADSVKMMGDYHRVKFYRDHKVGLYNFLYDKVILEPVYDDILELKRSYNLVTCKDGLYGLCGLEGEILLTEEWNNISVTEVGNVYQVEKKDGKYLFDARVKKIYGPFTFSKMNLYNECIVVEENGLLGLFSGVGAKYLDINYDTLRPDNAKNFIVIKDGLSGLYNNKGEMLFPVLANRIIYMGDVYFLLIGNKYGIISKSGEILTAPVYDEFGSIPLNKIYYVRQEKSYGIIGPLGQSYTTVSYDSIKVSEDLTKLYRNKKVTVVETDRQGGLVDVRTFAKFNTININNDESTIYSNRNFSNQSIGCSWAYDYKMNNWIYLNARDTQNIRPVYDIVINRCECYYTIVADINGKDTLWGIYDVLNMKEVMPPTLKRILKNHTYCDVFWATTTDHKIAYIDADGKIHTEFPYTLKDTVVYFTATEIGYTSGVTKVKLRNSAGIEKWGYIDHKGKICVYPQYDEAMDFEVNTEEGRSTVLQAALVRKGDDWGVIDNHGKVIVPFQFNNIKKEGPKTYVGQINRPVYGFVDSTGQVLRKPYFHYACDFKNGWARVMQDDRWGFMDVKGQMLQGGFRYTAAKDFGTRYALVCTSDGWNTVNKRGTLSADIYYSGIDSCKAGGTYVSTKKGYGYLNADNDLVVPAIYTSFSNFYKESAVAHSKKGHGLFSMSGKWLAGPDYYYLSDIDSSGMVIYRKEFRLKAYGVMSYTGKEITSQKFEEIHSFHEGLAAAKYKGKWGYLNTEGKWAIHPKFFLARDFYQGKAVVRMTYNQFSLIDTRGKLLAKTVKLDSFPVPKAEKNIAKIEMKDEMYMSMRKPVNTSSQHFKYFTILPEGNRFRIRSQKDSLSMPLDGIALFSEGYARIWVNSSVALLNMDLYKAEADIEYPYDKIENVGNNILKITHNGHFGYYSMTQNRWIWLLRE